MKFQLRRDIEKYAKLLEEISLLNSLHPCKKPAVPNNGAVGFFVL